MVKFAGVILSLFGAIITLAIISVVISRKSRAPEAIGAFANGIAKVVAAAVDPSSSAATNGNPAAGGFALPFTSFRTGGN